MPDEEVKIGCILNVNTFSFSVLNSSTGRIVPCMVFVLSILIVKFSEKSIWAYVGSVADRVTNR